MHNKMMENDESTKKDLILVVDDQPNNLKVIASILGDYYTLSFAGNGHSALKLLEKGMPDLILLDVMMPELDGYDVCRKIKEIPHLREIPVIFLSAKTDVEDIVKGFNAGAVDYILKPFNPLEVKVRVNNHLKLHQAVKEKKRITDELLQNKQLLESVLQTQREMICRINTKRIITYVNRAFASFFGKPENQLIGIDWYDLFPEHRKYAISSLLDTFNEHSDAPIIYQQKAFTQTGIKNWQEWKGYLIRNENGQISEYQFIGYDITDLVEKQQLEKEIEIARNTLKFKQNFLASMSHEIRTPLTGIIGIVELMEQTRLSHTQKDFLNTLKTSSDNLREIIDQVLDYSRIESGNVQLLMEPYSIAKLAAHTQKFFHAICQKPLEFHSWVDEKLPQLLCFDHNRIVQILNNLIINAVKFTMEGHVSVYFSLENVPELASEEAMVKIMVTDTGIGIREERQKSIFSPFSQVHNIETEKYSGLGIGLSICKEIVELHGGEIGVISSEGKGATIWFSFRALKPKPEHLGRDEGKGKKEIPSRLKILFVEDKLTTQKVIKILLNSMGHEVSLANNGKEAIEANNPTNFDLILMDIQMPVMDGITATRIIREKYPDGPCIVGLSANVFDGDREKYISLGMDEYMRKPATREKFEALFWKLFGGDV